MKFIKRKTIETIAKILNVNKSVGISSYDVVRKVKKVLNFKKVGHAGTLDPFADGVLIILIGRGATKKMDEILTKSKTYKAVLKLGVKTESGDKEGKIIQETDVKSFTSYDLEMIVNKFVGVQKQMPPQYSAKKVNGKPAYKYARKGIKVELTAKEVTIHSLIFDDIKNNEIVFSVTCSSGTYIRVLGEDIAEELGTVGHLTALTRISIGEYNIKDAVVMDEIENALRHEKNTLELQKQEELSVNK
jgi:tRNA pseudouridine55 synthase